MQLKSALKDRKDKEMLSGPSLSLPLKEAWVPFLGQTEYPYEDAVSAAFGAFHHQSVPPGHHG